MRAQAGGLTVGRGDVPEGLLAFGSAGHVFVQAGEGFAVVQGRGVEAQQTGDAFAVGEVLVGELEDAAVQAPEGGVLPGILGGQLFQVAQGLLDDGLVDLAQDHVFLKGLAGDVEGQVLGVHHALEEGQPVGDQFLVAVLDEHAAGVEIQAPEITVEAEEVLTRVGDVEQGVELHGRVHGDVQHVQRRLAVIGQGLVEGIVLFLGDGGLGLAPQGGLGVDLLAVHQHGEGHEGRMLADDGFHAELFEELRGVFLEVGHDARAALRGVVTGGSHGVGAQAVAGPGGGAVVIAEGRARGHVHLFGHHEHGIEAHAEAADDVGGIGFFAVGLGFLGSQLGAEGLGAGFGDGAQVLGQFGGGHAQAGVLDGQGLGVLVEADADLQRQVVMARGLAPVAAEAQFVQGVGSVGDELAEKDLAIGIQRIGENAQHLAHFGAKFTGLSRIFRHDDNLHGYLLGNK